MKQLWIALFVGVLLSLGCSTKPAWDTCFPDLDDIGVRLGQSIGEVQKALPNMHPNEYVDKPGQDDYVFKTESVLFPNATKATYHLTFVHDRLVSLSIFMHVNDGEQLTGFVEMIEQKCRGFELISANEHFRFENEHVTISAKNLKTKAGGKLAFHANLKS